MNVYKSSPNQVIGCIGEKGEGKFRGTTILCVHVSYVQFVNIVIR